MNADSNTDMNSDMDMDMDTNCSAVTTNIPMPQDDGALVSQFVCVTVLVFS